MTAYPKVVLFYRFVVMRPSPVLCGRLKSRVHFTTKNVGRGFYRGTGTGALGAHTKYGNYLIDWRKVRHFVVPELKDFKVSAQFPLLSWHDTYYC